MTSTRANGGCTESRCPKARVISPPVRRDGKQQEQHLVVAVVPDLLCGLISARPGSSCVMPKAV